MLEMPEQISSHRRKSPLIRRLEKAISWIRVTYGIKKIGIFGSFARGEQNRKSDIDVLVEFEEGHATLHNFIGLSDYLEELFKRKVDLLIESSLSDLIRPYIEKDVIWIEG